MAAVSAFEESLEESEIQGWETEPGFPLNWLLGMARQTLHSSYSSSSEAPSQEGINLKSSRMRFEPFCDILILLLLHPPCWNSEALGNKP